MPSLSPLLSHKKIVFLDMDGTIYLGDNLISGARAFLDQLKKEGILYYFLSNNSSRSKEDYVKKLENLGIPSSPDEILLSTDGVIDFLLERNIKDVYLVGTDSMKDMFLQAGIQVDAKNPRFVILGFDTELHYQKIKRSALLLQEGVDMIATHCDLVCPTPDGPIPDVGSMLAMFETATGKKPVMVFGKPNTEMLDFVLRKHEALPSDVVIIGDRIYTDLELAKRLGCDSVLVLSGESGPEDLAGLDLKPSKIVENVGELLID